MRFSGLRDYDSLSALTRYAVDVVLSAENGSPGRTIDNVVTELNDRRYPFMTNGAAPVIPSVQVDARQLAKLLWALRDLGLIVDD
jgi:hypothetical protein